MRRKRVRHVKARPRGLALRPRASSLADPAGPRRPACGRVACAAWSRPMPARRSRDMDRGHAHTPGTPPMERPPIKTSRIPLAIALSPALALTVGCAADRDKQAAADAGADMTPATTPAAPLTAEPTGADPDMDTTADASLGDGQDSDQPIDDTWITTKVKSSLLAEPDVSGLEINVDTLNGVVTLRGQVETQAQVDAATRIARDIEGVANVDTSGLTVGTAANE